MREATVQTEEGALRALITDAQALLGCPEWCGWSDTLEKHEHFANDETEFVIAYYSDGPLVEEILEIRHLSAPRRSSAFRR